jgi:HEAT repeat protein
VSKLLNICEELSSLGLDDARPIKRIIQIFQRPKNRDDRNRAAEALGQIGGARAVEALIKALGDNDLGVRWDAADALGEIGDVRAVEPLIETLRDEDTHVRASAAVALGEIGDARAVEPLIKALGDEDAEWYVRRNAAIALGEIGDARAVEPLIKALGDDEWDVRRHVAKALKKLKWKPDTDGLRAAHLVAKMDWNGCVKVGEPAVEPLIKALGDKSQGVRLDAQKALGKIGKPAVEPLIKVLEEGNKAAAWVLGKIGDKRAVEPLIKVLKDEEKSVRSSAARALGMIGDGRAVGALIGVLSEERRTVREDAMRALNECIKALVKTAEKNIEGKEKENILKFLKSKDPAMVLMGASMLKGILKE